MNDTECAWLAGLLEGEGCFAVSRGGYPVIKLGMTDADVIDRAASLWPGGGRPHRPAEGNRKEFFQVNWNGEVAVDLMVQVLPHMGARRSERIREVMRAWMNARRMTCGICEQEYVRPPSRSRSVYCSDVCADDGRKARNRKADAKRSGRQR